MTVGTFEVAKRKSHFPGLSQAQSAPIEVICGLMEKELNYLPEDRGGEHE